MKHKNIFLSLILLVLLVVACGPGVVTPEPTPVVIVVTATPEPTVVAEPTDLPWCYGNLIVRTKRYRQSSIPYTWPQADPDRTGDWIPSDKYNEFDANDWICVWKSGPVKLAYNFWFYRIVTPGEAMWEIGHWVQEEQVDELYIVE